MCYPMVNIGQKSGLSLLIFSAQCLANLELGSFDKSHASIATLTSVYDRIPCHPDVPKAKNGP